MKTVRMLTDEIGGDDEPLVAGQEYPLSDASADHWIKRKKAVEVGGSKAKKAASKKVLDDEAAARKQAEVDAAAAAQAEADAQKAANDAAAADRSKVVIDKPADGGATAGKPTET